MSVFIHFEAVMFGQLCMSCTWTFVMNSGKGSSPSDICFKQFSGLDSDSVESDLHPLSRENSHCESCLTGSEQGDDRAQAWQGERRTKHDVLGLGSIAKD